MSFESGGERDEKEFRPKFSDFIEKFLEMEHELRRIPPQDKARKAEGAEELQRLMASATDPDVKELVVFWRENESITHNGKVPPVDELESIALEWRNRARRSLGLDTKTAQNQSEATSEGGTGVVDDVSRAFTEETHELTGPEFDKHFEVWAHNMEKKTGISTRPGNISKR